MNFDILQPDALSQAAGDIRNQYSQLSTASDLVNLIDAIDAQLDAVDSATNSFIVIQLKKHQQLLLAVEYARTKLNYTKRDTLAIVDKFGSALELGSLLTIKVKALDDEISKVEEKLHYVEKVQLLKTTINKAAYAIDHGLYDQGAACISVILQEIDPDIIEGKYAQAVVPLTEIPEYPKDILTQWIDKLTKIFQSRFEDAAAARNVAELTKNFQMFPLLGQQEVGLSCYSKFICSIIVESLKTLLSVVESPTAAERTGVYSHILINLFESILQMLSQHAPLIKKYYGDLMLVVMEKIQSEIDSQICIIADTFYDNRRISKALHEVEQYNYPLLTKRQRELKGIDEPVDVQVELIPLTAVGDLVTEFSTIFHHWSLYAKFVVTKYLAGNTLVVDSSLVTKKITKKLLPAYESLYLYYFRRSLEKSITIEEVPSLDRLLRVDRANLFGYAIPKQLGDVPVSSVIEDVTLVFNTTLRGCLESAMAPTVKTFIRGVYQTLTADLVNGFFIKNLNENAPRYNLGLGLVEPELVEQVPSRVATPDQSMGFFRGASTALNSVYSSTAMAVNQATATADPLNCVTANNIKICHFIIYLNTVAIGQEYLEKVVNNLIGELPKYLAPGDDHAMVKLVLKDEFISPFSSACTKIISDLLVNLYNQTIKSPLLVMINEFFPEAAVEIEEENVDAVRYNQFSLAWCGLISPYHRVTHTKLIFDKLLRLLVVNLSNIIEKKLVANMRRFRITDLGALKLERDLSHLINQVCLDNYYLREKFSRVSQIVLLVGMDDDEYQESISHINQDGDLDEDLGINWVLTPQERNEFRQYRK